MGGDGGTLNNSRRDHVRARRALFASPTSPPSTQRVSISDCAISKQPLTPPHVVVDRLGQLYNKDALISYLLSRRTRQVGARDAFQHIASIKSDTRAVKFVNDVLMCDITKKEVTAEGGFSVGWRCGCVCKHVKDVHGVNEDGCLACGKQGDRVPLGMMLPQVEQLKQALYEKKQRGKKRRAVRKGTHDSPPVSVRKLRKLDADVA